LKQASFWPSFPLVTFTTYPPSFNNPRELSKIGGLPTNICTSCYGEAKGSCSRGLVLLGGQIRCWLRVRLFRFTAPRWLAPLSLRPPPRANSAPNDEILPSCPAIPLHEQAVCTPQLCAGNKTTLSLLRSKPPAHSCRPTPSPDHAPRGAFLHVRRAGARRRSVRRDRCEATRDATRSGLICRFGGSSGHAAPRLMGRTASGRERRPGTTPLPGNSSAVERGCARCVRSHARRS
jgi:hypothetical protein